MASRRPPRLRRKSRSIRPSLQSLEPRSLLSIDLHMLDPRPQRAGVTAGPQTLARFTFDTGTLADYQAVVDWGDGSVSGAGIQASGAGDAIVSATHYLPASSHPWTVRVFVTGGGSGAVGVAGLTVLDAPIGALAETPLPEQGVPFSGVFADFYDADGVQDAGSYVATIDWGDGQPSPATIAAVGHGHFTVSADHTFDAAGPQTYSVRVARLNGDAATTVGTADVTSSAAAPLTVSPVEGASFLANIATLPDPGPGATATVDWGDGRTSSGTIAADPAHPGQVLVAAAHVYRAAGTYVAGVIVVDAANQTTSIYGSNQVAGAALTAVTDTQLHDHPDGVIARFADANPYSKAGDFSAAVTWFHDGQPYTGACGIASDGTGGFLVTSPNFFNGVTGVADWPFSVVISDQHGDSVTAAGNLHVVDAPVLHVLPNAAFFREFGTIPLTQPQIPTGYSLTIDWGDGTSSPGQLVGLYHTEVDDGEGNVTHHYSTGARGDHAYDQPGAYLATETATDPYHVVVATWTTAFDVDAFPLRAAPHVDATAAPGTPITGTIARFGDDDPDSVGADFTATIDWGDGSTSQGVIAADGDGGFTVGGSHTYPVAGRYDVSVVVHDATRSVVALTTVGVTGADLTSMVITPVEGNSTTVFVAGLPNPGANASATVDWGDGHSSGGTVVSDPDHPGRVLVRATHTYDDVASYPVDVAVTDASGHTTRVYSAAHVAEAPLTATAQDVYVSKFGYGAPQVLATFRYGNPTTTADDFTATIDWVDASGVIDGYQSGFVVSGGAGGFEVTSGTARPSYAAPGIRHFIVSIQDEHGRSVEAPGIWATVDLMVGEGQEFWSQSVAVFAYEPDWDLGGVLPPGYTAATDWGDGITTDNPIVDRGYGPVDPDPTDGYAYTGAVVGDHRYDVPGLYTLSVTVIDPSGAPTVHPAWIYVIDPPISATGFSSMANQGQSFESIVATFSDGDPESQASDYTAAIDWGDGTTSSGTISPDGFGGYSVSGAHIYSNWGPMTIRVEISDGQGSTARAASPWYVFHYAPSGEGEQVNATKGHPFQGVVASFTDPDADAVAGDYTATIDWGDGVTSIGTVVGDGQGGFNVIAGHTFTAAFSFTYTVTIAHRGGQQIMLNGWAAVADAALAAAGRAFTVTAGTTFRGAVATFTYDDISSRLTDFSATIDWGDGSQSGGLIFGGGGSFQVVGSHSYETVGDSQPVTVTITNQFANQVVAQATAVRAEPPLSASAMSLRVNRGRPASATVASFRRDPNDPASFFSATIDWGDGQATEGTIAGPDDSGLFGVSGRHTYTANGQFPIRVAVVDSRGPTITATGRSTVGEAGPEPPSSGSLEFTATDVLPAARVPFRGVVTSFVDPVAGRSPDDYEATIRWGDGQTSTGIIVPDDQGGFDVVGENTFEAGGRYEIVTTILLASGAGGAASQGMIPSPPPGANIASYSGRGGTADFGWMTRSSVTASASSPIGTATSNGDVGTAPIEADGCDVDISPASVDAVAIPFRGIIATFRQPDALARAGDFTAMIDWGDGTTSDGTIEPDGSSGFNVTAVHAYLASGTYSVSVDIRDASDNSAEATSTVTVDRPPIEVSTRWLAARMGEQLPDDDPLYGVNVRTEPGETMSDLRLTVDWGDGVTSQGWGWVDPRIQRLPGYFRFVANHVYARDGTHVVTVDVESVDGRHTVVQTLAYVGYPYQAELGSTVHVVRDTIQSPGLQRIGGDDVIDWGDGTSSHDTFDTSDGYHIYMSSDTYDMTVSGLGFDGEESTYHRTVVVTDPIMVADGVRIIAAQGVHLPTAWDRSAATIATFYDSNTQLQASRFSAVIDWGDGTISLGSIRANEVLSDHVYSLPGTYDVKVSIAADDGGGATTWTKIAVEPLAYGPVAPILVARDVRASSGVSFDGVVATFTVPDRDARAGDFTATIDWGDYRGEGTVIERGDHFEIEGSHTYGSLLPAGFRVLLDWRGRQFSAYGQARVVPPSFSVSAGTPQVDHGDYSVVDRVVGYDPATSSRLYAMIDWGDGYVDAALIDGSDPVGPKIGGHHTYFGDGRYTVTTYITTNPLLLVTGSDEYSRVMMTGLLDESDDFEPVHLNADLLYLLNSPTAFLNWNWFMDTYGGRLVKVEHEVDVVNAPSPPELHGLLNPLIPHVSDVEVISTTVSATEGVQFSGMVASFRDGLEGVSAGDFLARIYWGDGTASDGTVSAGGGVFSVRGTHTYQERGPFPISVEVIDASLAPAWEMSWFERPLDNHEVAYHQGFNLFAILSGASVDGAPLVLEPGTPIHETSGAEVEDAVIATSDNFGEGHGTSTYTATIQWGDGTTWSGLVVAVDGSLVLRGSHVFKDPGLYQAVATVYDGMRMAVTTCVITIGPEDEASGALEAESVDISAHAGQEFDDVIVARFRDDNPAHLGSDHRATIDWGDNSSSDGVFRSTDEPGHYEVLGGHAYARAGDYQVRMTIQDGPDRVSTCSVAVVDGTGIVLQGNTVSVLALRTQTVLAEFDDPSTGTNPASYRAIIELGDGFPEMQGIVHGSGGHYSVTLPSETYGAPAISPSPFFDPLFWRNFNLNLAYSNVANFYRLESNGIYPGNLAGAQSVTVTILDDRGMIATGTATITFDQAVAGLPTNGGLALPVPVPVPGDYDSYAYAVDDWGDGTPVSGGPHTYEHEGSYVIRYSRYRVVYDAATGGTVNQPAGTYTQQIEIGDAPLHLVYGYWYPTWFTPLSAAMGEEFDGGALVTFADDDPHGALGDYSATIDWGDGHRSTGTVTLGDAGYFEVHGVHAYGRAGRFELSVIVRDDGGSTLAYSRLIDVSLAAEGNNFGGVVKIATGDVAVATLDDPTGDGAARSTVSIDWGDGTTSDGTIRHDEQDHVDQVLGNHTYRATGTYQVRVHIDEDGIRTFVNAEATIKDHWSLDGGQLTDQPGQATLLTVGQASVAPNTGSLRLGHALDFDRSPGTSVGGDPILVYNSNTVDVRPVIRAILASGEDEPVPSSIEVQLTWDGGTPQDWVTYQTTGHQAGDSYVLAAQVDDPVARSGLYDYSLHIRIVLGGGEPTLETEIRGTARVVVNESPAPDPEKPFESIDFLGAGWGISGIDRLVVGNQRGDILWVTGSGDSLAFSRNDDGTFRSPLEDFGTLEQNDDRSFTYTAKDQAIYEFDRLGLLTSITDRDGQETTFEYTGEGQLDEVTATDGGVTTFSYDPDSLLLETITEPGGRVLHVEYDEHGNVTLITDVDDSERTLTYDPDGRLTREEWGPLNADGSGMIDEHFTYEDSGVLSEVDAGQDAVYTIVSTAAVALGAEEAPDGDEAAATVEDGLGHTTSYRLDVEGRPLEQTNPEGDAQTWERDAHGQVSRFIDGRGLITRYTYDYSKKGRGDLTRVTYPGGNYVSYRYDPEFHFVTREERPGPDDTLEVTRNEYDPDTGDLLETTDPMDHVTTYAWDDGLLMSVTDARQNTTEYEYDAERRLIAVTDSLAHTTSYTYDANGNPETTVDARGHTTTTTYDDLGRLVEQENPEGDTRSFAYNILGQVTEETSGRGIVSVNIYDDRGLLVERIEDADSAEPVTVLTNEYDAAGNLTLTADGDGHATTYHYDDDNRRTEETTAAGTSTWEYDEDGNVVASTDANNHTTTFVYDDANRRTEEQHPIGTVTTVYDRGGRIIEVDDPLGHATTYRYDLNDRVIAEEDAAGTATTVYDEVGNVTKTIDRDDNVTTFVYDELGRLVEEHDPIGVLTTLYDEVGNVTGTIDAAGKVTTFAYDEDNRLIGEADPAGVITLVYDEDGNLIRRVNRNGFATTYVYDNLGRQGEEIDPIGVITTVYDAAGNVIEVDDADGKATFYEYDDANRPVAQTDPAGTTHWFYDAVGNVTEILDAADGATYFEYDADNRRARETTAAGTTTTLYDPAGHVAGTIDPDGHATTYLYDDAGRLVETDSPIGVTTQVYDPDGNVTMSIDPDGRITTYVYDGDGRLVEEDDPIGSRFWFYDDAGNVTRTVDANGVVKTYTYDLDERLVGVTDASGTTTTLYDAEGNVTAVIDPDGNQTHYLYDADGRMTQMIDPLGHTATYVYDDAGNLLATTDRDGRRRVLLYDPDERLSVETWYNANGTVQDILTFTYDADSNLLTASNAAGAYAFAYDGGNRLIAETLPFFVTLSFGYDAAGNVTSVTDFTGAVVASTYDADNRLTAVTLSGAVPTAIGVAVTYDAAGQRQTLTRSSSSSGSHTVATTSYGFDGDGRLTALGHGTAAQPTLATYAFTYDAGGRLTSQSRNGASTSYSYDGNDQLIGAGPESFAYDANGNRSTSTIGAGNQVLSDGTWTYTYDNEGNRVGKTSIATGESWVYAYDNANRLTWATRYDAGHVPQYEVDYAYDVFGNRVEQAVWLAQATTPIVQRHAYNGSQTWADLDGNNAITAHYLSGAAVDELLARELADGTVVWYLTDHLGSVRDLISDTGSVLDHIDYGGFGNIVAESHSELGDRFKFTGREYDAATGLQYNRERYYDAAIGVWTSQDPTGFGAGDANLYRYVGNTPTVGTDPTGESFLSSVKGAFSSVATTVDQAAGVVGTFALTGSVVSMESASASALVGAAGSGLKTGAKAVVNGTASAAVGTATLGWVDKPVELIGVTDADRAIGYDTAAGLAKAGSGVLMGTLGPGAVSNLANGTKYACAVGKGLAAFDAAGNVSGVAQGVTNVVKNGAVSFRDAVQIAGSGLGLVSNVSAAKNMACFAAGTELLTPDGLKRIEQFRIGDRILSKSEHDPESAPSPRRILGVVCNYSPLLNLQIGSRVIRTTPDHPFWVVGRGWTAAHQLVAGDRLLTHDNRQIVLVAVDGEQEAAPVYNLEVEEYHTYFVSGSGWKFSVWSHNTECQTDFGFTKEAETAVITAQQQADSAARTARRVEAIKSAMTPYDAKRTTFAVNEVASGGQFKVTLAAAGESGVPSDVRAAVRDTLEPGQSLHVVSRPDPRGVSGFKTNHLNDAEMHLLRAAQDQGTPIISTGATKAMCTRCQGQYSRAGVLETVVTPLL